MGGVHDFYCCGAVFSLFDCPACPCCGGKGFYDPNGLLFGVVDKAAGQGRTSLVSRIDQLVSSGEDEKVACLVEVLTHPSSPLAGSR